MSAVVPSPAELTVAPVRRRFPRIAFFAILAIVALSALAAVAYKAYEQWQQQQVPAMTLVTLDFNHFFLTDPLRLFVLLGGLFLLALLFLRSCR